jgi:amidase
MTTTDLDLFAPATTMLAALRARQISAVELLDRHLERIARYNPALNAIVEPDYERARATAKACDAAGAQGEDRPLLGLPVTIKESMNYAGLRTTCGVEEWAEERATADGAVPARVSAAGAVIMGKTNVPPMLTDWQANNPIYGRTNNPWDLSRTPGGSTGGGAAALAAGLTPLEFGSDIGGSIRVPAAFCGVFGHKPSETAVPRSGQFPMPPLPNWATAMGVQGPLARSAADLELALDVIAGPDVGEDVAWRLVLPQSRHERLADFRVAVMPSLAWLPVDGEIQAALDRLASGLSKGGARVKTAQPESFDDLRGHHRVYLSLLRAITSVRQPQDDRRREAARLRAAGDEFSVATADGLEASASDYITWHGQRERVRAAWRAFFREWDVLLAPIIIVPAFPHTDLPMHERTVEVNGQTVPYMMQIVYPALATLSGQPATAFPAGLTRAGLPIGLQAIGPYLEDRTPIRFAGLVEREFGGFVAPPGHS